MTNSRSLKKRDLGWKWIDHAWVEVRRVVYPNMYGEGHTEYRCANCGETGTEGFAGGP